jgi:hypothetical protein
VLAVAVAVNRDMRSGDEVSGPEYDLDPEDDMPRAYDGDLGYDDSAYDESALEDDAEPAAASLQPDVLLDVPLLKVDEISLDVEDLRAKVSLQADVLDLLNLSVGADVVLGSVQLQIKGVEAQALLKVRLDRVADVIHRVLTTIDRNPQIIEGLSAGVREAAAQVGHGARRTLGEVGRGAGRAVGEVAAAAAPSLEEVGRGTGRAITDVGREGARAARQAGATAAEAGPLVGQAGAAVGDAGTEFVEEGGGRSRRDSAEDAARARRWEEPRSERPVRRRRSEAGDRGDDDDSRRRPRFPRESDRGSGRRPP